MNFFFSSLFWAKSRQNFYQKKPDKQLRVCTQSVVAAVILEGFPQFVCVRVRRRKGDCKRTVSLWKTSMKQHSIWFTVRIRLCICIDLILWEVTCKQQRNVVPLSALWCCIVIHHKPWQRLCFVPYYWQCSHLPSRNLPSSHAHTHKHWHTRTHTLHLAAQHCHQVVNWCHRPHFGHEVNSSRCLQSVRGQHCRCRCRGGFKRMSRRQIMAGFGGGPSFWWADIKSIICSLALQEEI